MFPMTLTAQNDRMWKHRPPAPVRRPGQPDAAPPPTKPALAGEGAAPHGQRLATAEKGKPVDPTHKLQQLLDKTAAKKKEP